MMPLQFEDLCFLEGVFEKLLHDANKAKTKEEVITLIRIRWSEIKETKFGIIDDKLSGC